MVYFNNIEYYNNDVGTGYGAHNIGVHAGRWQMGKNKIKVNILIPAYKEPYNVIERMFFACQQQKLENTIDLQVWFCVDGVSREEEETIKTLAIKYGISISKRPNRQGFRAGALNYCIQNNVEHDVKYLIVLDIDQAPKPEMTQILVEQMEKEENRQVHFIMFPQIASNSEENSIAKASDNLQRYDYYFNRRIRSKTNSAFVVGTNWIGRTEFIREVPFEDGSIVEDQASSIRWHANNAVVKVINAELALCLAPDTIESWRAQQARWSYGALFNLRYLKKQWRNLTLWQKIDYFCVMTWYLYAVPTVLSIFIPLWTFWKPITLAHPILPIGLLFANLAIFTLPMVYCKEPRLTLKDMFTTAAMQHMCLDLYLKSIFSNLFGKKFSYIVSDKTSKQSLHPHRNLWFPYFLTAVTAMGFAYALYLNPPAWANVIRALEGAPLSYTTYIMIWLLLSVFWIWGTIYYTHKSNRGTVHYIHKGAAEAPSVMLILSRAK